MLMPKLFNSPFILCAVTALISLPAAALTTVEVNAQKQNIKTIHSSAIKQCKSAEGNARDVCQKQADGNEKVATAELNARARPSSTTRFDANIARAQAEYEVATQRCDDQSGDAKASCKKEAEARFAKAREDARLQREKESKGAPVTAIAPMTSPVLPPSQPEPEKTGSSVGDDATPTTATSPGAPTAPQAMVPNISAPALKASE